jgi:hypothetical protein
LAIQNQIKYYQICIKDFNKKNDENQWVIIFFCITIKTNFPKNRSKGNA